MYRVSLCAFFIALALSGVALAAEPAPIIEVREGDGTLTLDNGLVAVALDMSRGRVSSMKLDGRELLGNGGWAGMQFYAKGHPDAPGWEPGVTIERTDEIVDVGFLQPRMGFLCETHYVVRRDDSGYYHYVVMRHDPAKNPGDVALEQVNLLVRADPDVFTHATIGPEKTARLPSPQQMQNAVEIMDATYRLADGAVDAKYDWTLEEDADAKAYGLMGDGVGLFIVKDSGESLNGAPIARELTVHATDLTPVLLRHFVAGHYGRGKIEWSEDDGPWSKIAGPWFVFATEGGSHEELWRQADEQAKALAEAWPYDWMQHPLYVKERGSVTGTLAIADGTSPEGALVLLAPPPTQDEPNWRTSGRGYFFWTHAEADGSFAIHKVRPGDYVLRVLSDEQFGEHQVDGVTVTAERTTELGDVLWKPEVRGHVAWQIGRPDGTAAEFRNGGDVRQWGLWLRYPSDFPRDVNFTIGESDPSVDWNYVQPAIELGGGSWRLPSWSIGFDLDDGVDDLKSAHLRIAVAAVSAHALESADGERWAGFRLALNDTPIDTFRYPHDSGVTRSAARGNYHEVLIPIDPSLLEQTGNVLTLTLASTPPVGIEHQFPYCSIAYDALRLELERATSQ